MTNALKNQADSTFPRVPSARAAQNPTPSRAVSALPPSADDAASTKALETQARNLIGQTFFGTLLKQMRDSPFKSDLFSGGKGGQAFAGMYDQHLAQRMAGRVGGRLTRPLVKKYKQAAAEAYKRQQKAAASTKEATDVAHAR